MSVMKLTCLACRVTFTDADLQREHYKSEWHRYNLKRKVASLPPLAHEDFQQMEAQHNVRHEVQAQTVELYCECCHKSFATEKAIEQHNKSRKHLDAVKLHVPKPKARSEQQQPQVAKIEELVKDLKVEDDDEPAEDDGDSDWESVSDEDEDYDTGDAIKNTDCLFCSHSSDSVEANVSHMMYRHSFFIPDAEYLVDLEGLISYLGEKIGCGLRCLWCCDKGKAFQNVLAVQRHMVAKGHCKMRLEAGDTLLEYADYYDYSSSYPEGEEGDIDQEVAVNELRVDDDLNLVLPSGETVGHRSLARYFKQSLRETPLPPRRESKKAILHNLLAQYRALGWSGSSAKAAAKKRVDLQFLAKRQLKLGLTTNKVGQPHLRNQYNII